MTFDNDLSKEWDGISLCVASKNRTENLVRAVESWIQCPDIAEINILDYGSESPVFRTYPFNSDHVNLYRIDAKFWKLTEAYNMIIQKASYNKVAKADADHALKPDFFQELELDGKVYYSYPREDSTNLSYCGFFYMWKSDFMAIGGFNERIEQYGWDDNDLKERLDNNGIKAKIINLDKIHHIEHSDEDRIRYQDTNKKMTPVNRRIARERPWPDIDDKMSTIDESERKDDQIQKIIHQSWKNHNIPECYDLSWIKSWKIYHPSWSFYFWTDHKNRKLIDQHMNWFLETYDLLPRAINQADAARAAYMYVYGGVYVDLDVECLANIEPLLQDHDIVIGQLETQDNHRYPNAFLASRRGHPFWLEILEEIEKRYKEGYRGVESLTGPIMFTDLVESRLQYHDIKILPSYRVYPVDWHKNTQPQPLDKSYAISYWTGNWSHNF